MLVDANILLYAVDGTSPFNEGARSWMEENLNGSRRVGIPWSSLVAFMRIATNPRAQESPLDSADAWSIVRSWLAAPTVWVPAPGAGHAEILGGLIRDLDLRANLIGDAQLAALCLEHGLTMISADTDFARFPDLRWHNPVAPRR